MKKLKKSIKKAEIGIIGGSHMENFLESFQKTRIGTPYGLPPIVYLGEISKRKVAFIPRHGPDHSIPPHLINYRANIYALHLLGVKRIIATNAVGAINPELKPGELLTPHDFVDFTKHRKLTFYDSKVVHVDFSVPYCPEIRSALVKSGKTVGMEILDKAILVCTEGPRFETPAEIEAFRRLGCDIVGMTGIPEAVLARELGICYATLCYVSNMAAGMQRKITPSEVGEVASKIRPLMEQVLRETIRILPHERNCPCKDALKNAQFK